MTFSSSYLKFFTFSFLLQMDSIEQTPTGWEAPAMMGWSQQTPPWPPSGPGFISGQKTWNPPHSGIVVDPAWLALGAPCDVAKLQRSCQQRRDFPKVCRFAQEFLILAIVDQAVYLMGPCRVLLTGY